jgi:phosphohistidine phosphatase SixA
MSPPADEDKSELFRRLGYGGDPARYDRALEEAGLSRAGKQRISTEKVGQVEEVLASRFVRACQRAECQNHLRPRAAGRILVPAARQADCEACGGSVNAFAVEEMVKACGRVGWTRLCIVGGSPNTAAQLRELTAGQLEVRIIDGTLSRARRDAEADLDWAHRVVIWGSTELAHKVSALYKGPNVITVARRGVAELARGVTESAARSNR